MKNITINTVIIFLFAIGITQSQTADKEINSYLILSKNIQQLKPIMLTATELSKEDGTNFGKFFVIFCGKTVQDIKANKEFVTLAKQAKEQNLKIFVCGLSLKKFGIPPNDIPDAIEITENGILYGFQLTKNGFITLTI